MVGGLGKIHCKSLLSHERRMKRFADAPGKRPRKVAKWLGGQRNFTVATPAMLSAFFGQQIVIVG